MFFDEANTTENIGLIKEIMCDRRLKGRQINDRVKFIAACNPYKKLVVKICIHSYMHTALDYFCYITINTKPVIVYSSIHVSMSFSVIIYCNTVALYAYCVHKYHIIINKVYVQI